MYHQNLNLPKWVKETPQTFKCYLAPDVISDINTDFKWFNNHWVMSTDSSPRFIKSPMDVIEKAIASGSLHIAQENGWHVHHRNKSQIAKQVGIPILTAHSLDYDGVGGIIATHLIDAIRKGAIVVNVHYKFKIGKLAFLPTIELVANGYPTRLDQNLGRAVKVTRAFHNVKDTESRTALTTLIKQHCDYYYGPYVNAKSYAEYTVPYEAINFME